MTRRALAALALIIAMAGAASAQALAPGGLRVEHPWSRPAPQGGTGAGFLKIVNEGKAADRLLSVASPISTRAEIHESMVMGGRAMMHPRPGGLPVPAGATVELKPGGWHIMFVGLRKPLKAGDRFPATLTFAKAGKLEVEFVVQTGAPAAAGTPHDH